MSPAFLEAVLEGRLREASAVLKAAIPEAWPEERDERWLRRRLEQMQSDANVQQWLPRALVLRDAERVMVGHAGFHGEPGVSGTGKPGVLELGYTVFPPYRRRGFATEAAVALMDWAGRERGIQHFIASVAPDNPASLSTVRKLGFVQTGEQWDEEDGLELVFELGHDRARGAALG
jgi:ribosomal-protein-alanine N-acetyltransferase